ncbi:MAG: glycosyltransferase family 1 protein [Thermoleophilaceae bacterium]
MAAINARAAIRREIGGVERVAREMALWLPRVSPGRYRVIAPRPALAHRRGQVWEQLALPALARGSGALLCPANLAPVAGRRNVVMLHDVAPFVGDWYGSVYGNWHRLLLPRIARGALRLIAPSETVRGQLVERLGADPNRTRVIPLGVDPGFGRAADPEHARARYGLERPYVLAVGSDLPRKNFALLDRLAGPLRSEGLDVVLAGTGRSYMQGGDYAARVLDYVEDGDLPGLYAGAAVFAMPSLYEGFGLPCLEAMACGTPVVASTSAALPESCGEGALFADPHDPEAFAEALIRAATDPAERSRLVAAGHERAASLTWERTARAVDAVIGELL